MWMNLTFGLPYLVAVVAGVVVCLVAGPKGPASRTWRLPGAIGFGLLALQHLVQTGQTVMLYSGVGPDAMYRSGMYAVTGVLSTILTVVGVVLIAMAVVRGRSAGAPAPLGGWGPPPGPVGPPPAAPVVSPENPYGQPRPPVQDPSGYPPAGGPPPQPSTGADENPKRL